MKTKLLEIRDEGTFIPMLCVDINPGDPYPRQGSFTEEEIEKYLIQYNARLYLLLRCGYPCDERPNIAMTHLSASGDRFSNDHHFWGGRTRPVAHKYIIENWESLNDGDVVDVQFILGETKEPKVSEQTEKELPL
jgi:hypothetical protein